MQWSLMVLESRAHCLLMWRTITKHHHHHHQISKHVMQMTDLIEKIPLHHLHREYKDENVFGHDL